MKQLLCSTALLAFIGTISTADQLSTKADGSFSTSQKAEIERYVEKYILENPEIIIETLKKYEAAEQLKAQEARAQKDAEKIEEYYNEIFFDERTPTFGENMEAGIVVEFYDYNCGYCKTAAQTLKTAIEQTDARRIYKNLPVLGDESYGLAWISQTIMMHFPEKFEEFHMSLLDKEHVVTPQIALAFAENIGIDPTELRNLMNDENVLQSIRNNIKLAEKLEITGTPTFVFPEGIMRGAPSLDILVQVLGME